MSRSTKSWFATNKVRILDWPLHFPDLNLTQNVLDIMVYDIYDDCRYNNIQVFKRAIKDAWANIEHQTNKKLVSSC